MTSAQRFERVRHSQKRIPLSHWAFGWFSIFCILLLLKNSEVAVESIGRGLALCFKSVIPSLFPFMVLSELAVSGGMGRHLPRLAEQVSEALFGVSGAGLRALLLGLLCGSPIGARCTLRAYERGEIDRTEAEHVLCFSNIPSSAFLIVAVGGSLWENRAFGIALYASALTSALITGVLFNRLGRKRTGTPTACEKKTFTPPARGVTLFTGSIRSAGSGILLVCAYVIFFSAFLGALRPFMDAVGLPAGGRAMLVSFFEISGGMSECAALENAYIGALLSAFATGWSGLSVHLQIQSVCDVHDLSLRPYRAAKLLQGLLCVVMVAILLYLFPKLLCSATLL